MRLVTHTYKTNPILTIIVGVNFLDNVDSAHKLHNDWSIISHVDIFNRVLGKILTSVTTADHAVLNCYISNDPEQTSYLRVH